MVKVGGLLGCSVLVILLFNVVQIAIVFFNAGHIFKFSNSSGGSSTLPAALKTKDILKPWPYLPSFMSWVRDSDLARESCEAYFGNGYSKSHVLLKTRAQAGMDELHKDLAHRTLSEPDGSFRCFYNEALATSLCEGTHMVLNPGKIAMSQGGEPLDQVAGRDEEIELPTFSNGAFQIRTGSDGRLKYGTTLFEPVLLNNLVPADLVTVHKLRSLFLSIRTVKSRSVICSKRIAEPTLVLIRFEYANLFHTSTDWLSAYISSRVFGVKARPHLVLLDGHCVSPMDDAWGAMFSSVTYAKHFSGSVCFDHLIFVPLGYDMPLFKHLSSGLDCHGCSVEELEKNNPKRTSRLREFGEFVVSSFGLPLKNTSEADFETTDSLEVNILFIRRENYLAHPRHSGKPESRISNEEEIFKALKDWAGKQWITLHSPGKNYQHLRIAVVNGLFAHVTLKEQVRLVREADIILGAHGAGLTHLLFARPTTTILELISPKYRRPHFRVMSGWMGMDYQAMNLNSDEADINEVIESVDQIVNDIKRRSYV